MGLVRPRSPMLGAVTDLAALRRRQYAAAADAVEAVLRLQEVVEIQSATHVFDDVESFLRTAPDEETRAHWSSWVDRATAPLPDKD